MIEAPPDVCRWGQLSCPEEGGAFAERARQDAGGGLQTQPVVTGMMALSSAVIHSGSEARINTGRRRWQIIHCPETGYKSSACYFLCNQFKETSTGTHSLQHRASPQDSQKSFGKIYNDLSVVRSCSFRRVKDVSCSIPRKLYQHSYCLSLPSVLQYSWF